jgi:hypothetical protein
MRVGTYNYIPWIREALRHQLVAYAFSDIVDPTTCFSGEAAQKNMVIGKLRSGTGSGMVQKYYCLLRLCQSFETDFLELPYGERAGGILDKSQIHISNPDVPGSGFAMRFEAQNLLG